MDEIDNDAEIFQENDIFSLENLFICEDYIENSFQFNNGTTQKLLCSNMSCTSPELTGQIIWPAAILLSHYMVSIHESLQGKCILELGAGCGLGGIVASNYSKSCIITDGNEVVLRLLEKNKAYLKSTNIHPKLLIWGDIEQISKMIAEYGPIDMIIGADVILWPQHIEELLLTIRLLLASNPINGKCFISYVVRANSTTRLLFEYASKLRLNIEETELTTFITAQQEQEGNLSQLEKYLYRISLQDPQDNIILEEEIETARRMQSKRSAEAAETGAVTGSAC